MVKMTESIRRLFPFDSHFMELKAGKLHYVDEGNGDPIVMLHGNPSWSFLFRGLIEGLRHNFRVIAPDHLGCGMSDKPQDFPYRLETHLDNFEEFVENLKLERFTLLVHDWGGAIGMGFATRYPERIKRLIITNSAAFSMNWMPLRIAVCRIPKLGEYLIRRQNVFCRCSVNMTTVKKMPDDVKKAYLAPYDSYENRIAVYQFVKDIPMYLDDPSYELLLYAENGIWMFRETPVLILWGMKDWCFTPVFLEKWKNFLPNAKIVKLNNAGHYLFEDQPDEILNEIKHFLNSTAVKG